MRVLPTVTLTTNQKRVLAKIFASPTPKVAGEEISGDQNLIAARDQLGKLGVIEFISGEATVTDKGQQLARESNIVDDSGQLTPDGEQLAHTAPSGKQDQDTTRQPSETPPAGLPAQAGMASNPPAPQPGGFDLTMSHTPEYGSMELLQELLSEVRKVKRPGWGHERRRAVQFHKKQEQSTPVSTMNTVKTTNGVMPQTFKQFYTKP